MYFSYNVRTNITQQHVPYHLHVCVHVYLDQWLSSTGRQGCNTVNGKPPTLHVHVLTGEHRTTCRDGCSKARKVILPFPDSKLTNNKGYTCIFSLYLSTDQLAFLWYGSCLDAGHVRSTTDLTHSEACHHVPSHRGSQELLLQLSTAEAREGRSGHVCSMCVCVCVCACMCVCMHTLYM